MGLIEIVLAGLCFNITCPGDENLDKILSQKKQDIIKLEKELSEEHIIITTMQNGELSGTQEINGSIVGTGVAFDVLKILQKKYGFNYTIKLPEENVFGSSKKGVYDMLVSNKANVAAAFQPVLNAYRDTIAFSPSLDTGEWQVLLQRPKESATGSGLMAPFTAPVWILIILSLAVMGPIIYFLVLLESRICTDSGQKVYPLPSCIWFVYGALFKQGTTLSPITDSSRLIFSTWWIFIVILTAFYTANLTAFLTLSKFTLKINYPEDIGAKHYSWMTSQGNAIADILLNNFNRALADERMKIRNMLGDPTLHTSMQDTDILDSYVKKSDVMFIRESPIVDHLMYEDYKKKAKANIEEEKRCTFVKAKFPVTTYARAFAYSKDFKYKVLFDSTIQYLVESGIIKYSLAKNLPDTQICPLNLGNKERRLRNSDLLMTYMIISGGLIVSAVVFIIELVIQYTKKKKHGRGNHHHSPNLVFNKIHKDVAFNNYLNNNNTQIVGPFGKKFVTPPPSYHTLFNPPSSYDKANCTKKTINGRDYWVVDGNNGNAKLVPLRTPSALLFQFTN